MNFSLHHEYYGNTVGAYLGSAGTFVLVLTTFFVARRLIVSRLRWLAERTETKLDDVFSAETLLGGSESKSAIPKTRTAIVRQKRTMCSPR